MSPELTALLEESREIVAIARAVRMMPDYWPEWLERPEHGDGGVDCDTQGSRDLVSEHPQRGDVASVAAAATPLRASDNRGVATTRGRAIRPRRQPKLTAASLPTEPAFTARMNAAYDLAHQNDILPTLHERHREIRSVSKRMRECSECGTKAIRWMAAQPEVTHIGRNGRRLAAQFGVTL